MITTVPCPFNFRVEGFVVWSYFICKKWFELTMEVARFRKRR